MTTDTALRAALALALAAPLSAQIPDGWYVYGAFSPSRGQVGVFASHPRAPGAPTTITNLQGDLTVTGSSAILYRKSDGALLVGERSPTSASVDLHVVYLQGTSVLLDASFSLGTGGPCCGEVPQMALLPDDRVVVAVTDVSAGPLQQYLTTSYGWQGVGIVDTESGLITPIDIANGASIVDVFNGLALSPDSSTVYLATYVSGAQGDIWRVPIGGGSATLLASIPAGLSNLCVDAAGAVWATTLDPLQGLFRVDAATGAVTHVPQTNGSLNAIALEEATGMFAVVSANAGSPARAVFWMDPNGGANLLSSPGYGTLSGIAINPNPEVYGAGTPGVATYDWVMPNPGGLPQVGHSGFSLTVQRTGGTTTASAVVLSAARLPAPLVVGGTAIHVDPSQYLLSLLLPFAGPMTQPLPIPANPSLVGASFAMQSFHLEPSQLAASPGVEFSIL